MDKENVIQRRRKRRNRNVLWFTPPWNHEVSTNVGKIFFRLLEESFRDSELKCLFNKNSVKLGFSTTRNFQQIINSHNKRLLKRKERERTANCNCRIVEDCPLEGNCLQYDVIYKAKVKEVNVSGDGATLGEYLGCTNNFKTRYRNHKKSLNLEIHKNESDLSKFVWRMRQEGRNISVKWEVVRRVPSYKSGGKYCCLCALEKVMILKENETNVKLLNGRIEVCKKCPHQVKSGIT